MNDQPDRGLARQAENQHGVFTRMDAHAVGIEHEALKHRVKTGRYQRLYPGAYAIGGSVVSIRRRLAAAVHSLPALSAVSHQTAAELWGITRRGFRCLELVTTRWDRVRRPDLRIHESLDLVPDDVVELDGIPVTTAVRTVVDLGASNKWIVEDALEQGIRHGLFDLSEVEQFVNRVARRGRRGVGVIRPLLESRRRWDTATESVLEDRFRRLLENRGFPRPVEQLEVRGADGKLISRADFAYPEARLLIELDSEAHHMDRSTFRRDRSKQNQAVLNGWTVLRYTWWDVTDHPGQVCREVSAALSSR